MRKQLLMVLATVILLLMPFVQFGQAPTLGTTSSFALFTAAGALNNVGASNITGDIGSFTDEPTGLPGTGTVTGTIYSVGAPILTTAKDDVATAWTSYAAGGTVIGTPFETQILTPGVYQTVGAAVLNGELTLDGNNDPNSIFIIKVVGGALTVGASGASNIKLINMASACNIYWQVGGAFSLSGGSTFNGTVIADGAINMSASTLNGRALSKGGIISTSAITLNPADCNSVGIPVFTLGSTSTRCQEAGSVTYTATAINSTSIAYSLDATTDIFAGNSIVAATGAVTYAAAWSGTSVITATAQGVNGPTSANHTVTITPTVGTPVFTLGTTSTKCQSAGNVTYTATAANSTSIAYSLDAVTDVFAGNSIIAATGVVTYAAAWSGTSVITATASGCNGPTTATHTVTITSSVGTPVFALGATSTQCQSAGDVTYTATAANSTSIAYSLDAVTDVFAGNSIVAATGVVTYAAAWSGTSVITATAAGCNGPTTAIHTVTITPNVGTPVFTLGATTALCQGAGSVTYTATAANSTSITYSLDATSDVFAGNSIVSTTGIVTYATAWSGTSVITATAVGCNGPLTATHTVTITPLVETPVFILGATSTQCQSAGDVTYTATAANSTSIAYSLDAVTEAFAGNSIAAATGVVTYAAGWNGTSVVTATAAGCNGPTTATHTVTITPAAVTPIFALGATSTQCQGVGSVTYTATAANSTSVAYSLDAVTEAFAGNSIVAATGVVTYAAGWSGTSVITASAVGCNGITSAIHTVTITPSVETPVFVLGETSTLCQNAGSVTYTATAANSTSIVYSLDAVTEAFTGNSIAPANGAAIYAADWSGTSVITASAAGCNEPTTAIHTATITPTVGTPVFDLGTTTTQCQSAGNISYTATAANSTSMAYSLDVTSAAFVGNSIVAATGIVTYAAAWSGTSVITATAEGCNGPSTATHTVTITPSVETPVFDLGATTTLCQSAVDVTYTATAANSTSMTYSLDATSAAFAGNSIVAATGVVTYSADWSGTSVITATAEGCNGPVTSIHTVTINPLVGLPIFALGATSTRCQGSNSENYSATSSNSTNIAYSLDSTTTAFMGNSIATSTGVVTYDGAWSGTSIITATAEGCNGPTTSTHTVTITPTVGTPVFALGATTSQCQSAGSVTYTATATNSTSIVYSLDASTEAFAGNSIVSTTGIVTYATAWSGTSVISASAEGCNGPASAIHTVTINKQPYATTGNDVVICVGESVTIGATAIAGNTYNWTPITGLSLATISNPMANPILTTTYTLTETVTATACGNTNSVTVTVNNPPAITVAPNNQMAKEDGLVNFSVVATGTELTYQWRKGTENLINQGNISGVTSATLTVSHVTIVDTASNYNVVISGLCSPDITSANAILWLCLCPDVSVKTESNIESVMFYPNPFSKQTTVMINDASETNSYDLRIYNSSGAEVMFTTINQKTTTVDLNSYVEGIYFFKVTNNDKLIQSGKLISK